MEREQEEKESMAEESALIKLYKRRGEMKLLKIIIDFFQRIVNGRHERCPITIEARIASLRRDVRRIKAKTKQISI